MYTFFLKLFVYVWCENNIWWLKLPQLVVCPSDITGWHYKSINCYLVTQFNVQICVMGPHFIYLFIYSDPSMKNMFSSENTLMRFIHIIGVEEHCCNQFLKRTTIRDLQIITKFWNKISKMSWGSNCTHTIHISVKAAKNDRESD